MGDECVCRGGAPWCSGIQGAWGSYCIFWSTALLVLQAASSNQTDLRTSCACVSELTVKEDFRGQFIASSLLPPGGRVSLFCCSAFPDPWFPSLSLPCPVSVLGLQMCTPDVVFLLLLLFCWLRSCEWIYCDFNHPLPPFVPQISALLATQQPSVPQPWLWHGHNM